MNRLEIDDILSLVTDDYKISGETDGKYFTNVKSIEDADSESLVWIKGAKNNKSALVDITQAKIIICDDSLEINESWLNEKCFIIVNNPKLIFIRVIEKYFVSKKPSGFHATAIIHPEAKIDDSSYIGPFSYIGKCEVGKNVYIYGNCYLYDNVKIGNNVTIHAGTVIGTDGFGYSHNEKLELEKFPHIGGVIIEDDVEIGANTCIDRGALGNTIINAGTKIDNLVHIGHNCVIGKHCVIIANTMLGGSVVIKDYSWIAPSVSILNQLSIGEKTMVGLGSVVNKSIPDGETWMGVPAKPLKEFANIQKALKKLIK